LNLKFVKSWLKKEWRVVTSWILCLSMPLLFLLSLLASKEGNVKWIPSAYYPYIIAIILFTLGWMMPIRKVAPYWSATKWILLSVLFSVACLGVWVFLYVLISPGLLMISLVPVTIRLYRSTKKRIHLVVLALVSVVLGVMMSCWLLA
jgi:hypothetical protein